MKNNSVFYLSIFLGMVFACANDDEPNVDLNDTAIEILPSGLGEQLDTDLIELKVAVTNSAGGNIDYDEVNWTSSIDGDMENRRFEDLYFLSVGTHVITCEVSIGKAEVSKQLTVNVGDDPRGNWEIRNHYNGVGSDVYTPDKLVLNTPNFIIYSNTDDLTKRLIISEFAEQVLSELKELFNTSQFDFPGKVIIGHQKETGNGFIGTYPHFSMYVGMPESGFVPLNGSWNFNIEGIKHELMHLVEISYIQGSRSEQTSHRWFWEGIAVLVSQGERFTTWDEVSQWRNQYGGNPISIQEQPTGTSSSDGHYYPLFGLSVAYLLDPNGLGKTYEDVIAMYQAIKDGLSFEAAFHNQFGMTVNEYETNYFDIIETYLN